VATAEQFELNGITWDHSRGFTPLVAASQRFHELHPDIEITWSTLSLQAFADVPVELLSERFDLIVIDHPWSGFAASGRALLPLESHLPADLLAAQDADSIGHSHRSYAVWRQSMGTCYCGLDCVFQAQLDHVRWNGFGDLGKNRLAGVAAQYGSFVDAPETRRGLYFESGEQPGLRSAWTDPNVNMASPNFFLDTLPLLTRAFVRPRHAGYVHLQDRDGLPIHSYLRAGGNTRGVLEELNALYHASREQE
jgi:hypothetical protein